MIDVLVIVVAYRSAADLPTLLDSIPAAAHGAAAQDPTALQDPAAAQDLTWSARIVNNDPDEDLSHLAGPQVEIIEAGANLGYAGGINAGLLGAEPSRWVVFLNPDLRLEPGSLARLAAAAGTDHAAVPVILDPTGTRAPSLRREPALLASLGDALLGDHWPHRPDWLSEMVRDPTAYDRPGLVDWATGAALLVPTPIAAQVGPWDADRFFLYSEETDYCRRLREAGVGIVFVPTAVVIHRGGGSGTSPELRALLEVNRARYYRKWHPGLAASAFTAVVVLNSALRSHRPAHRRALAALVSPASRGRLPGGRR